MKKKLFALPLVVAAVALGVSAAWAAAPTEPPASLACLDIEGGTGFSWDGTTIGGSITLVEAACKQATYTLVVLDEAGGAELTTLTGTAGPSGTTVVTFNGTVTDDDSTVCVYATSSIGGRVFDVGAPSGQQCLLVNSGSAGGTE